MNSGGGGAYTKGASKRKTSSLVLSKAGATPSGAGAVTINPRRNDFGGGSGGGRVGARGGQLELQSVTRAPLAAAAPASTNPAEQRNGGRSLQRSAAQSLPQRAYNPVSNNGYQNRGQRANHQQGGPQQHPRGPNLPVPGRGAGGGRTEGGGVQVAAQATSRQASTGEPRAQPVRRHDAMAGRGRGQGQQASISGPRTGEGQGGNCGQQQNGATRHPPQQRLQQQQQQQQQRPSHNNPYQQQQQRQSQPRHLPCNATAAAATSRPNYKGPPPSNGIARAGGGGTVPGKNRALSDSSPLPGARQAQEAGGVPPISSAAKSPAPGVDAVSLPPAGVLPPRQPSSAALVSASASGAGAVAAGAAASTAGAAVAPDGDAALRARLAEIEARHTAALARVQELEESNFELEASMQLIEVEASHRVEKQARALQSELSFKDHQLTAALKSHTTAVRELNAERSKRKRDQQQADRQRAEAAASASAAASEAAAVAKAAAEATAATAISADKNSRAKAAARRRRLRAAESIEDKGKPPLPTLADLVLAESSHDVMVLLNAGGAGHYSLCWGGGDGTANSSGSDGDTGGLWVQTPLGNTRRRGRSPYSPSSGAASDSVSPGRTLGRGFGSGGGGQNSGGTWRAGRKRDFSGASPLSLAFTPVRPAQWERRVAADESSAARRAPRSGSGHAGSGGGTISTGKSSSANWTNTSNPRRFWGGTREGEEVDMGGASGHGGRLLNELRCLSSRMFTCAIDLVEGEACAGDLLDVLVGFLETLSGEADDDLDVLASAVRLIHRTVAVTQPAAVAIAFGGTQYTTPRNGFSTAAAVTTTAAAAVSVDSDSSAGGAEGTPQSIPPSGKGKKRTRHELGSNGEDDGINEKEDADDENTGDTDRGRRRNGRSSGGGRRARLGSPAPCSLFIAGEPVTIRDVPAAPAGVSSSRNMVAAAVGRQGALGIDRQGERLEGEAWAGRCGGEGLGRRIKKQLVALFQRGATCGCPALVEACLQATLSVLWDRQDEDLVSWGCLLDLDSFDDVMFSELHRSAWELGAQVLRVLTRNAVLFRRLATGERDPGCGNRAGGVSAAKSVMTEVTALPTPPSAVMRSFRGGGLAGDTRGDTGAGGDGWDIQARGSFLRRLCLEAVDADEHAAFGENVGLRLSVVRLAFGACQRYGAEAARLLFGEDGVRSESGGNASGGGAVSGRSDAGDEAGMPGLIPTLVTFVRLELEDWERRRYSQPNPIPSDRGRLLKEAFQLLWALAMHAPLPLRDMAQGAGRFNTMVSVVSRFYNSVETEEFQVHKEAMMLMEKMN